jgi:hypothetical protein
VFSVIIIFNEWEEYYETKSKKEAMEAEPWVWAVNGNGA